MISSNYNIARDRIYAVGYSNGGMMAYGLANHKSDLVAGIVQASNVRLHYPTSHPMPILHIHGTSDNDIPYGGSDEYISVIKYFGLLDRFQEYIKTSNC